MPSKRSNLNYERALMLNEQYHDKIGYALVSVRDPLRLGDTWDVGSVAFANRVADFQQRHDLDLVDGILGPGTWKQIKQRELTDCEQAYRRLVDAVAGDESGGDYAAMNRDGEYKGKFDDYWRQEYGHAHPASHRSSTPTHVGLSFGLLQFTQDSGSLGELLARAAKRNRDKFDVIFGDTSTELVSILTREGESGLSQNKLRGPRVQPVPIYANGQCYEEDIWEEPWVTRFKQFGRDPEFQQVQVSYAVDEYLKPMLDWLSGELAYPARKHTESLLAALFSCAIHRGVAGAQNFIEYRGQSPEGIVAHMAEQDSRYEKFLHPETLGLHHGMWDGVNCCDYFS